MARIGLSQLPRKIADHTGKPAPKYRTLYDAAVEGRIPAEFDGRWTVDETDVPKIATALGLGSAKPTKATRKGSTALAAA